MRKVSDEVRNAYHNIKMICKQRGLMMGELERSTGRSAGYFRQCAHGLNTLGAVELIKVAEELCVDYRELLETPKHRWIKDERYMASMEYTYKYLCPYCGKGIFAGSGMNYEFCPRCGREIGR